MFDMNPYLEKSAFSPLKDEAFFKQLYIRDDVVCWSNDIDIAAERMWTDSEPVTEHWTYPEDWPTVGDTGPDGSPIVFVTGKGFPLLTNSRINGEKKPIVRISDGSQNHRYLSAAFRGMMSLSAWLNMVRRKAKVILPQKTKSLSKMYAVR